MGKSSNVHLVLNSRDRTGGNDYNALLFNAENQNIIQGDIHHITVSEVNFPYDIPNIQEGSNIFTMQNLQGATLITIFVQPPNGFYTGSELATAINAAATAYAVTISFAPSNLPLCSYNSTNNQFTFTSPTAPAGGAGFNTWNLISPYTFPITQPIAPTLGKDILSLMGYPFVGTNTITATAPLVSGSAPLIFTQYIDICSPQLCKFQYLRDGSTTNLARRSDVICRLYVSNNIALYQNNPEGVRPFIINRQFFNARIMKWTADNSVGTVDINLYDDCGQPLATTWTPRPYQITFNAVENVHDEGLNGGY
jgi:hypothetical protein